MPPAAPSSARPRAIGWRIAVAGFCLTAAAVWHMSLLWLAHDTPAVLAAVLLLLFVFLLALRARARAVPVEGRTAAMRLAARLDRTGLAFVAFLLVLLLLFHVGYERASSDGRSYFIQVRSLLMDGDLDFSNDEAAFGGHGASQYPIGAPLLWSPFFAAAHGWLHAARLLGADVRTDGYYYPYQRAIGLATLLYGFAGLVLAYRVARAYFARGLSALATLGFCAASFVIWYLTVENSMVHGVSMFATTLFLFLWHRWRPAPTTHQWAGLGAAAGLMALVRWQNAAFVVFPLIDLLWPPRAAPSPLGPAGPGRLTVAARGLGIFGVAAALTFVPQLIAWQAIFADWLHLPTAEHAFAPALLPPYLVDVLFSSNRGLLTWTPVVWASLLGLLAFAWKQPRVGLVLLGALVAQLWVNAAVDTWWGGAGFGARRFANCALVFTLGLAALLDVFRRRPLLLPSVGLAGLLAVNGAFMLDYQRRVLGIAEGVTFLDITRALYAHVGNPLSFPVGAYQAWRYDVSPSLFDQQRGRTYADLTIDVGTEGDEAFLGHGWSAHEGDERLSYRWSDAASSTLLVPLRAPTSDYVLEVDWAPLPETGLGPQVVRVEFNGDEVAAVRLEEGPQRTVIDLPAARLRPNLNHLRFSYRVVVSPASLGRGEDTRTLAVQVFQLRLRPAPAGGVPPATASPESPPGPSGTHPPPWP